MEKKEIKQKEEELKVLEKDLNLKLENCNIYVSLGDYTELSEFIDYVNNNNLCDEEIIYYSNAIDYLKENDCSLNESLEIAIEYGYNIENINSELLASLLASQNNRNDFYNLESDIEEYYTLKEKISNLISDLEDSE